MKEYLVFKLGKGEYAVDIYKVQEICSYETPTVIVDQPNFVKGVINLRGVIIPILDLRIKFDLAFRYDSLTVVIILNLADKHIGIVVDSVCDVINFNLEQMQQVNGYEHVTLHTSLIGLLALEDRMIQVVNIDNFIL